MNRSTVHDTFSHTRHYAAPPARVFQAFADPAAKAQWFSGPPDTKQEQLAYDFREGGTEISRTLVEGVWYGFRALYNDIVADERIVYTYEMDMDGRRTSVSITVVELRPAGDGTDLVVTEHGVYLDGVDEPGPRRQGTEMWLAALGAYLAGR